MDPSAAGNALLTKFSFELRLKLEMNEKINIFLEIVIHMRELLFYQL